MNEARSVAIVGRPNVGKSRLFNRLVGRRISIVHDRPGVTRDVVVADSPEGYVLMDTGGIGMQPAMTPLAIQQATEEQAEFAIRAASLLLFVVDGREGLLPLDQTLAEKFRKMGKQPVLVVNKMDEPEKVMRFPNSPDWDSNPWQEFPRNTDMASVISSRALRPSYLLLLLSPGASRINVPRLPSLEGLT